MRYGLQYSLKSLYDEKMKARKILSAVSAIIIFLTTINQHAKGNDWAQWRGLKHDGIAARCSNFPHNMYTLRF